MPKAKQLTVACENRPGTLAHLARTLGDAKVNILALCATTSGAEGSVRLVVDNANKAKKALAAGGIPLPKPTFFISSCDTPPGRWGISAENWQPRGSTLTVAMQWPRKVPGRRAWCLPFPT